jgi:Putative zinc-finger
MSGDVRHCTDVLAEHAAGLTSGPPRAAVEAHLRDCPSCRAALADWKAVAAAMGAPANGPPAASMVRGALTRAALAPRQVPVRKRRLRFAGQLLRAEMRLVRPSVWLASMVVMTCAVVVAVAGGDPGAGATVLSLIAPLVAAAGIAGVYGPERDPAFEALAITVTSPRLVLLARVTLVFAYDLVLALAASALVHLGPPRVGIVHVVAGWLLPMTLLSALCLLLAMWIGPNLALGLPASLWMLRLLTTAVPELAHGWLANGMRAVWTANPGSVAATLALVAAVVALSRRRIRPRGGWPGPLAW